jgi:periplasmic protein TonB
MPRAPRSSPAAKRLASAPRAQSTPAATPAAAPATLQPPVTVSLSWQSQLGAWLEAHKQYPETAREYGQEGTATIRFTVARDGHVTNVVLVNGSGVARLDSAAVQMLQGAIVPAFPTAMPQADMTITVSINYALDDNETTD